MLWPGMGGLLAKVVQEKETYLALEAIMKAAREATRSRNGMIGVLDVEAGHLELVAGDGEEWTSEREGRHIEVAIGSRRGITGYVAATGKTFVTGNVVETPAYNQLFFTTVSEIAAPVRDRHGLLKAVINLESDRKDAYTAEDIAIVEAMAHIVALVLERDETLKREEALVEVGTAIDDAITESEILGKVIDVAARVLQFQACSIFLLDSRTQKYVLRASTGALRDRVDQIGYDADQGFTGTVCAQGVSICLERPQNDPRWQGKYTEIPSSEIASFVAVPIKVKGKSVGAIRALRRIPDNEYLDVRFTEDDERLLHAIADQLAVSLENIRTLEKLIHTERMGAWGELSAKSSHMIGNRVFALRGDINELEYLLRADTPNVEELRSLYKNLHTNVGRIQELLQDFRDFVTATQLHRTPGDLNQMVAETVNEMMPKRSDIDLTLHLDDDLPKTAFDPQKLRLAISELIENSMNFIEKGKMRIATRIASSEDVLQAKLGPGSYVAIDVEDDGPGVEQALKEQIFQPFYSSRVKGMGLGLSIVKGIADAHGGTVIEAGDHGKGAKFVILLPTSERQTTGAL